MNDLAEKFFSKEKRKSLPSLVRKRQTYEEPEKEDGKESPEPQAPVQPPKAPSPRKTPRLRLGKLSRKSSSERHTPEAPSEKSSVIHHKPAVPVNGENSKSESFQSSPNTPTPTDDSKNEQSKERIPHLSRESSVGGNDPPLAKKIPRPGFGRWVSSNSNVLHFSKPNVHNLPVSGTPPVIDTGMPPTPPISPPRTPGAHIKHSFKRWLWPGPLSASDAQSIRQVIQTPEMPAISPMHPMTPCMPPVSLYGR
ncbi:uncharacterized protein K452DRAFT_288125 [Aplosporella prunicola CBS 121167]|uniref:Uncharacterized protein n=1 Tax=Aplosporella prunicola CBS 121167 TaxID=1176127 RepID=A0A6A6BCU3_9PEZI|nr:uncharacterized protein K452DRAFT_288125 [Aplosporella prunicola CBS 121167]KAF2141428.1 hypothetical protein K452DRAFT_288125 [Aplosporella prunicola CBS 121167]